MGEPASAVSAAGDSVEPGWDAAVGAADADNSVNGVFDDELDAGVAGEARAEAAWPAQRKAETPAPAAAR